MYGYKKIRTGLSLDRSTLQGAACATTHIVISKEMDTTTAIHMMSALAQPTRMNVFQELAKHQPGGLPVGELAALVGTPPNTMSTQLAILSRAGLVASRRNGRVVTYVVRPEAIQEIASFLLAQLGAQVTDQPAS